MTIPQSDPDKLSPDEEKEFDSEAEADGRVDYALRELEAYEVLDRLGLKQDAEPETSQTTGSR